MSSSSISENLHTFLSHHSVRKNTSRAPTLEFQLLHFKSSNFKLTNLKLNKQCCEENGRYYTKFIRKS